METKYNLWSFYLLLFCIGVSGYSLYSNINNSWLLAPPNYILLLLSVTAFVLGIKGFKDKRNLRAKLRSWLTVILAFFTSALLALAVLFTLFAASFGANEHIKTSHSPDNDYTIDFYHWNAGAAGSFGIRGELNGPLWFKKRIYYQQKKMKVNIEWKSNDEVSINNHILNLDKGDTYGY